ncbi:transglutaminase-like domain-containing protein [Hoeflea sp.]|uniref:transglutaminase-like domain-containing protein n=1 Tax=Hoeflea sp. TaxID=1940281 RepID=UPI0019B5BB6E|nr:transglutaminase-like domain-containing protein [Hoeflea sp.]MBC7285548.1 transglutaminase domain-containing protein [Hoeflea sp.]
MTGYAVEIAVAGNEGPILAPSGLSSAASACTGCTVTGGSERRLTEATTGQEALLVTPEADKVAFCHGFSGQPAAYPEAIFQPAPSRYTRAAEALVDEARQLAGQGDALERAIRLARGVAEKFTYAHPEARFNEGFDHVPHLGCGLTEGSCVEIHTYLLASFRAAGIEAGYVVGIYFREDGSSAGGHCWVVTRIGGATQEWDVSHFLRIGRRDIGPAPNPKGGFRVPVGHSMGLSLRELGVAELKFLSEPVVMRNGLPERFAQKRIRHLLPAL